MVQGTSRYAGRTPGVSQATEDGQTQSTSGTDKDHVTADAAGGIADPDGGGASDNKESKFNKRQIKTVIDFMQCEL